MNCLKRWINYLKKSDDNLHYIYLKNYGFKKILLIITFVLIISMLLVIVVTPKASGYEISIYGAYPAYFWVFFIGSIFSAIFFLLYESFGKKKTKLWILGFFAILLVNFVFFILPFLRGYCVLGGAGSDVFSHIGWVKEMVQSGHVGYNNFYPILHIFILSLTNLLGASIAGTVQFAPSIFWILYSPFVFLIARSISKNNGQAIFITCFSFTLIFQNSTRQYIRHFFLLFLLLCCYIYIIVETTLKEKLKRAFLS